MALKYTSSIFVVFEVNEWSTIYGEGTSWGPGYPLSVDERYSYAEYRTYKSTPSYVSSLTQKTTYSYFEIEDILTGSNWDWGTGSAPGVTEWDGT